MEIHFASCPLAIFVRLMSSVGIAQLLHCMSAGSSSFTLLVVVVVTPVLLRACGMHPPCIISGLMRAGKSVEFSGFARHERSGQLWMQTTTAAETIVLIDNINSRNQQLCPRILTEVHHHSIGW